MRERILVHLAAYARFAEDFECPEAMCQAGISRAIGKSRAHTTLEINRMREAGLLTERLAHVKGAKSKRKTYSLTPHAMEAERNISRHIRQMEAVVDGQKQSGEQAVEHLMEMLQKSRPMAYDILLSSKGLIDTQEHVSSRSEESSVIAPSYDLPDDIHQSKSVGSRILMANEHSKRGDFQEALKILAQCDDCPAVHSSRASILRKQGDLTSALQEINLALKSISEDKPLQGARCQMEKAMILFSQGNLARSLELLNSVEGAFRKEESQIDLLRYGINRAIVLRGMGDMDLARQCLTDSLGLAEKTGLDRFKAYAMVNLCDILNEQGDYEESAKLASQAADIFGVLAEPLMHSAALFNLGAAQAGLGKRDEAVNALEKSISILENNDLLASRISWLQGCSEKLRELGLEEKAKALMDKV